MSGDDRKLKAGTTTERVETITSTRMLVALPVLPKESPFPQSLY